MSANDSPKMKEKQTINHSADKQMEESTLKSSPKIKNSKKSPTQTKQQKPKPKILHKEKEAAEAEDSTSTKKNTQQHNKPANVNTRKRKRVEIAGKPLFVQDPKTVFVGGLTDSTTEDNLIKAFSQCGTIVEVFHHDTKHIAFVTFEKAQQATKAINTLNETNLLDTTISVRPVKPIRTSRTVNVSNLSASTTFASLYEFFSKVGPLQLLQINHRNPEKPFAMVGFSSFEASAQAMTFDGKTLDGSTIKVSYKPKKKGVPSKEPTSPPRRNAKPAH
jgi:RNA recognition motif-containing protein